MSPLLITIDCYLRRTGMPPSVFGRRVANDPRLVADLRAGRIPRDPVRKRIEAFVAVDA